MVLNPESMRLEDVFCHASALSPELATACQRCAGVLGTDQLELLAFHCGGVLVGATNPGGRSDDHPAEELFDGGSGAAPVRALP